MRKSLWWTLGLTALASVVLVWRDEPRQQRGAVLNTHDEAATWSSPATALQSSMQSSPQRAQVLLPARLETLVIDHAKSDPFSPPAPVVPKLEIPRAMAAKPEPAPMPAQPTAPPLAWRYWGSMQTPEGQRLLLLAKGEQVLPVQVGTALGDGYAVESLSVSALRFVYVPLGTVVELPIPGP